MTVWPARLCKWRNYDIIFVLNKETLCPFQVDKMSCYRNDLIVKFLQSY